MNSAPLGHMLGQQLRLLPSVTFPDRPVRTARPDLQQRCASIRLACLRTGGSRSFPETREP